MPHQPRPIPVGDPSASAAAGVICAAATMKDRKNPARPPRVRHSCHWLLDLWISLEFWRQACTGILLVGYHSAKSCRFCQARPEQRDFFPKSQKRCVAHAWDIITGSTISTSLVCMMIVWLSSCAFHEEWNAFWKALGSWHPVQPVLPRLLAMLLKSYHGRSPWILLHNGSSPSWASAVLCARSFQSITTASTAWQEASQSDLAFLPTKAWHTATAGLNMTPRVERRWNIKRPGHFFVALFARHRCSQRTRQVKAIISLARPLRSPEKTSLTALQ